MHFAIQNHYVIASDFPQHISELVTYKVVTSWAPFSLPTISNPRLTWGILFSCTTGDLKLLILACLLRIGLPRSHGGLGGSQPLSRSVAGFWLGVNTAWTSCMVGDSHMLVQSTKAYESHSPKCTTSVWVSRSVGFL